MAINSDRERLEPRDREEWRAWLQKNHESSTGVWVVTRKKTSAGKGVTYEEAVEEAVAFGWIDSRVNRLDERTFLQLYTPRKPGSTWSKSNKERVERLTARGMMAMDGMAKVEAAKRDGSWNRLDRVMELRLPPDLQEALKADMVAKKNFEAFADFLKKQLIFWVESAKRAGTREDRINKVVESARAGRMPGDEPT
jgi:uncharacterized protein YdeI (YjbR/CyaY-like superfamily)